MYLLRNRDPTTNLMHVPTIHQQPKKESEVIMSASKQRFVVSFVLSVAIAFGGMNFSSTAMAESKKLRIAAVFQLGFIDFFAPTRKGAEDAAKKFGVEFKWLGPSDKSIQTQISIIETLLSKGIDGLVVESIEPASLLPIVRRAQSMGIPVVVTNDIMPDAPGYDGYCGADALAIGKLQGQQLEQSLLGKSPWAKKFGGKPRPMAGEVAFVLDAPGAKNLEGRVEGARKYLEKFPKIKDVGKYDGTVSLEKGVEVITNIITAHPDLTAIISAASGTTVAAAMAVRERNLQGKVMVVGMDLLPQELQLIKDGIIQVTIGQNPYLQGYLPVEAICEYLINNKPIKKKMATDLEVVDISNVDEIIAREKSFTAK